MKELARRSLPLRLACMAIVIGAVFLLDEERFNIYAKVAMTVAILVTAYRKGAFKSRMD
jgi:hypothetical protein